MLLGQQVVGRRGEGVHDTRQPEDDVGADETLGPGLLRHDVSVADRGKSDDRKVERVDKRTFGTARPSLARAPPAVRERQECWASGTERD